MCVSLIFGLAIGLSVRRWPYLGLQAPFRASPPSPEQFADRFASDFQLTDDQKAEVKKIFAEQHDKVEKLHKEVFPRFETIRNETRSRIRVVLPVERRADFDEFNSALDRRLQARSHPVAPPPAESFDNGPHGPKRPLN